MTLAEIAEVVGGAVQGREDVTVTGPAFVDTRSPEAGGLFVAIAGERVDGHDYAAAAVEGGAAAVLGSRPTDVPTVVVEDAVVALGVLARHVLGVLGGVHVLALTGSQGKTGTKDFLAHVLAHDGPTVATAGNFNNEIGVPLTVLHAQPDTAHLVVEMGARGVGHIAYLCSIAPPTEAAVVNVGTAHIGEFGSREAIAQAKGEIVEALAADGTAVLNADDPLVAAMVDRTRARVLTFGTTDRADVQVTHVTSDDLDRASFELVHRGAGATVHLQGLGRHQVENAAAAAALALAAGLDLDTVAEALTDARSASHWRMELTERADGLAVINDAYNANPESTRAALDALAAIGRRGRRTVAVLGEMRELGETAARAHHDVGAYAAGLGIDLVVTVGDVAEAVAEGARSVAGWPGEAIVTAGREEALARVGQNVSAADVVLVKASRGAALEHVAIGLVEALGPVPEEEGR
jgi:UDP-N-acetylmuramoyl-tripeptide--D-alanyl-D-alanine ligase